MAFRVRSTKFRHVFGKPYRKEYCYENVKITRSAHDGCFCAVNPKYLAIVTESASGGAFIVVPLSKTGRFDGREPKVCGHRGAIMDLKWNPFNDQLIASCSEDCTVKIWQIPEGGLITNMSDWLIDLSGHQKRVAYIEWHPTADSIILSAGYDCRCILWNTETAEPITIISCHTDNIFSISWNWDGSLFASTCKDKKIRVIDPRTGEVVAEGNGPLGPKASKVAFLGDRKKLFVVGFSKTSERLYSLWDIKDMSKPLCEESIDSSCGTLLPFYDHDTHVVFTAGKGDGNIRYFEITDTEPYVHFLSQHLSSDPQRGLGSMPKRGLDTSKNEIMRFYKLLAAKDICEVIPMIVPRRSEEFQEDIYPPTPGATPSLTADEWISGQNRNPILISLRDGKKCGTPKITTSKAVQKKELSQGPTISAYKAVKRTRDEPAQEVKVKAKAMHSSASSDDSAPPIPPLPKDEDLPASLKNIRKLSTLDQEDEKKEMNGVGLFGTNDNKIEMKKGSPPATSHRQTEKRAWSPTSLVLSSVKMASNKENEPNNNFTPISKNTKPEDPLTPPFYRKPKPIKIIESASMPSQTSSFSNYKSGDSIWSPSWDTSGLSSSSPFASASDWSANTTKTKSMSPPVARYDADMVSLQSFRDKEKTKSPPGPRYDTDIVSLQSFRDKEKPKSTPGARYDTDIVSQQSFREKETSPPKQMKNVQSENVSPRYYQGDRTKNAFFETARDVKLAKTAHGDNSPKHRTTDKLSEFEAFLTSHGNLQVEDESSVTSQTYLDKLLSGDDKSLLWSPKIPSWYNPCNAIEIVDTSPTVNEILAAKAQKQENSVSGAVKSGEETHLVRPSQILALQRARNDAEDSWHMDPDRYTTLDWSHHNNSRSEHVVDKPDSPGQQYGGKSTQSPTARTLTEPKLASPTSRTVTEPTMASPTTRTFNEPKMAKPKHKADDFWHLIPEKQKSPDWEHYGVSKDVQILDETYDNVPALMSLKSPSKTVNKSPEKFVRKSQPAEDVADDQPVQTKPKQRAYKGSASDSTRVHIRKTWTTHLTPEHVLQNGMPQTDPELRKAYFQQVEEINSLKQQLSVKDKRIRQLEQELKEVRQATQGKGDESNC